jgi:hypothetical protein
MSSLIDWTIYQGSTKYSPYKLVYGHTTVIPWEIKTGFKHVVFQKGLIADNFKDLVMNNLIFMLSSATLENIFKGFCTNN